MGKKNTTLSDQLRRLMESSGKSRNAIAIATGIDPATLCRFVQRKGGLSTDGLDKIGEYLKLVLSVEKPAKGKK
jgi:hypothetical protein